ncbi:MAG: benenodin family lasso peptide [Sphingomonas sp.]|nr:benenodin family lasso peptide [Sphingomonas sp.]
MDRGDYRPDDGRIDLGVASVETKGIDGNDLDSQGKRYQFGISDD